MRSIICVVTAVALVGIMGCAKQDSAPADQTEAQTESQPISNEDFESGEVEGLVEDGEDVVEETPEGEGQGETP